MSVVNGWVGGGIWSGIASRRYPGQMEKFRKIADSKAGSLEEIRTLLIPRTLLADHIDCSQRSVCVITFNERGHVLRCIRTRVYHDLNF